MKDKETMPGAKGVRLSVHAKPASGSHADSSKDVTLAPSYLQLKRILVPLDFSERSEKALRYALRFSEQFGSALTLIHVIQPMVYPADFGYPPTVIDTLDDSMHRAAESRLGALAARLSVKSDALVRAGQPYHEITLVAKELEIDLIIITTHGHTGLKHALLGSTAERVVRHSPCPVLTLREPEHDFA